MQLSSILTRSIAVAAVATLGLTVSAAAANAADAVAPSFDLAVPTTIHAGDAAAAFGGTLVTNDGATNVWVKTNITGADANHVKVEWNDGTQWLTMPDTEPQTPGLQLTFGDGDLDHDGKGFSVPAGITNVTQFRIAADKAAVGGPLTWTSELVSGDNATPVASQSGQVAVTPSVPTFDLAVPTNLMAGSTATPFDGTLVTNDGATNIWVKTNITGVNADHVQVEWNDGSQWLTMPDTEPQTPGLQLTFGDGDLDQDGKGFSVPAGITNVTHFRIAADSDAQVGTLDWSSDLVTGDAGAVLRSTSGSVAVDRPVAAKAGFTTRATAVVVGKDVRFSGTLLDANHADAPLAGKTVTVFRKVADQAPVAVTTAVTDANGSFAVTLPATESATYFATYGDVTTASVDVRAAKDLSSVSASRKHAHRGQLVSFTGDVVSSEARQPVLLQIQRANGSWKNVATATANRAGAFKISSPLVRGARTYRVSAPSSALVDGDTSRTFVITVK